MVIDKQTSPVSVIRRSLRLFLIIFMLTGAIISGVMLAIYRSTTNIDLEILKQKSISPDALQAITMIFSPPLPEISSF